MNYNNIMYKTFMHHRSGHRYTVIAVTNWHIPSEKFPITVVYIDTFGKVWSRPFEQFKQKFIEVQS